MDRFLKRKKKANDSESETQLVLFQKTKKKNYKHLMSTISLGLLNVRLMLLSFDV